MDVTLILSTKGRTRRFHLQHDMTVIGRQHGTTLRIPSAEVSRRHCVLRKEDGCLTVEDLESRNGTFLNGAPISAKEIVRPGDRLRIGPVTFLVEYEVSAADVDVLLPDDVELLDVIPVPKEEQATTALASLHTKDDSDPVPGLLRDEETTDRDIELAADSWRLPGGDDLRDILAQMDEPKRRRDED
jgi:pSer/pThr/pTyr-binding forkhead associated (FHA) protein